jgi:hypothetical protein
MVDGAPPMAIPVTGTFVPDGDTVIFAVAVLLLHTDVNVTVAVPTAFAVTTPLELMLKTLLFELLHVTSRILAFAGVNIGVSATCVPTFTLDGAPPMAMLVTKTFDDDVENEYQSLHASDCAAGLCARTLNQYDPPATSPLALTEVVVLLSV